MNKLRKEEGGGRCQGPILLCCWFQFFLFQLLPPPEKRQKLTPPPSERIMVYVRQETEEAYTALHLVSMVFNVPSLGFTSGIPTNSTAHLIWLNPTFFPFFNKRSCERRKNTLTLSHTRFFSAHSQNSKICGEKIIAEIKVCADQISPRGEKVNEAVSSQPSRDEKDLKKGREKRVGANDLWRASIPQPPPKKSGWLDSLPVGSSSGSSVQRPGSPSVPEAPPPSLHWTVSTS